MTQIATEALILASGALELELASEFLLLDVRSASPSARNNWNDFAQKLILRVVVSLKSLMHKSTVHQNEGMPLIHHCRI